MHKKIFFISLITTALLAGKASAQVDTSFLLGYDFGSTDFDESWVNPDNATAGNFVSGAGMSIASSAVGATNSDPWVSSASTGDDSERAWFSDDVNSDTPDNSILIDKYVEFSISADTGYLVNPSQIGFLALTDNNNSPESYQLWISTDGFDGFDGTETASTTMLGDGSVSSERSGAAPQDFELFTHDITSISAEQVSARVYWHAGSGTGSAAIRMDKVYMSGTTVIPEPGTCAAIFGFLALGIVFWVRRRK
ncbi:MAG: PEP-CTERM sorting domain-containing protein [Opitutales bacterium]|nr:PEP-CTERM sorting domain-containing protein [Opitutales bacterium]MCH8541571.1 hypothetical protein [Opitutales bacterium]